MLLRKEIWYAWAGIDAEKSGERAQEHLLNSISVKQEDCGFLAVRDIMRSQSGTPDPERCSEPRLLIR